MSCGIEGQIGASEQRLNWVNETVESIDSGIQNGAYFWSLDDCVRRQLNNCDVSLEAGDIESLLTRVKKYDDKYKIFSVFSKYLHKQGVQADFKNFLYSDLVDQKLKVEFVKQEGRNGNLYDGIHKYGIKDEKDRIEIAKIAAATDHYFIRNLKSFKIFDHDSWLEIVKIAVKKNSRVVMASLKKLRIKDEDVLFEIAQFAAKCDRREVSQWVSQFGHKSESELIELLKETAKIDGEAVALWIGFAKITNQRALIDIARLAIEQNPPGVARNFRNFGINDEVVRVDIFKELLHKKNEEVVWCVNKFDINDKQENIKIAKLSAQIHPHSTAVNIKKFKLDDQQVLVELAKAIVELDCVHAVSCSIRKFGIADQEDRIQIARLSAARDPYFISHFIENFDIQDEKVRVEIAKMALSKSVIPVLERLKNYQITDESFRIELAKVASHEDPGVVSRYIKTFCIHDEKERVEIAKIEARKSGEWVSKHIKEYQITDQDALFEIAKLAACENPRETCKHLANYEIVDNNGMRSIELAKLIAQKDGRWISIFISDFHIEDQAALIEIATLSIQQNASDTSELFKRYGIQDEQARIELAKISAGYNGNATSCYIEEYHIKDPNALFEIAKIALQQKRLETLLRIRNFKIKKPSQLLEILCLAIAGSEETFSMLKDLPEDPVQQLMYLYDRLADEKLDLNSTLNELQAFEKKGWPRFALNETIKKAKDPHTKRQLINWLAYTVGFSLDQNVDRKGMMWMQNSQCLEAIYDYREPREKYKLSNRLIHIATSEEGRKIFDALITKLPKHLLLPAVILTQFQMRKAEPKMIVKIIDRLKKKEFRDPRKLRPVINALNHILDVEQLTFKDYTYLLELMSSNDIVKYSKLINSIIDFEGGSTLKKSVLEEKSNDLQVILCELFQKQIPIKGISDFFEKYEATFKSFRNPDAINIYASKLTTLSDKRPIQALARFVESVLEGTFKEERYIGSSHLTMVFNGREVLLKEWKRGLNRPLVEINRESAEERVDFHKIMFQSVHHLDKELSPILIDFLMKTRKGILKEIGMQLQITEKGSRESHILLFQRYCIRLANPKLNVGEQKTELDGMSKHLGLIADQNCEFFNDIKAMKEGLRKEGDNREGWTVVDTDDPQDLVLSGTEILGSCQRIDGNPEYNKCLLGYIMDGKNRMLAVKNQSGKIIARSIFRILWDQENQTPVLFLERVYPEFVKAPIRHALITMAKERAKTLGLPLLSTEVGEGEAYPGVIESLGSNAPYEYCDAIGGKTKGTFAIEGAHQLSAIPAIFLC